MERRNNGDDFGSYPPSALKIPSFPTELAQFPLGNLLPLPPMRLRQIPLEIEAAATAGGAATLGSISPDGSSSENQANGSGHENLNIYWEGDVIEAVRPSHRRNQQWPLLGISNSSSNNNNNHFDLETAMCRLQLSATAAYHSNGGGGGGGSPANYFDLREPTIPYRRLLPNGLGHRFPDRDSQNGRDRRFSAAVQRQLQRERCAAAAAAAAAVAAELPSRNPNAQLQQRLLIHHNSLSLDELRGRIHVMARDEYGSFFLAKKLLDRNPNDIEIIFWEIRDRLCELMVHQFARHVVDKLIEVGNQSLLTGVVHSVTSNEHNFVALCNDMHGTHGVQNLIEHLSSREQISMAESAVRRCVLMLIKNSNGQHVIKCCMKCFTPQDNNELLNEIAKNCLEIARDKTGCCVLQECVLQAEGEAQQYLLQSIISNSLLLSKDPYGNFVVQNALEQNIPYVTEEIIKRLSGSFAMLCFDKFGSHVVERCLNKTNDQIMEHVITEMMHYEDFLSVVQSPFGNYVIQTALMLSKGGVYNSLVNRILEDYPLLHSHPFGRRVLLKVRETRSRIFAT